MRGVCAVFLLLLFACVGFDRLSKSAFVNAHSRLWILQVLQVYLSFIPITVGLILKCNHPVQIQVQTPRMLFEYSYGCVHEDMRILEQDPSDKQNCEFVDGIILQTCLCLNICRVEIVISLPHPSRWSIYFANTF